MPGPTARNAEEPVSLNEESAAWTGGQYSVVRYALGLYCAAFFVWLQYADAGGGHFGFPLRGEWVVGVILAILLTIGYRDRVVALVLATWLLLTALLGRSLESQLLSVASLPLLLHAATPRAPFGSVDAAGRTDPRGDWKRSPSIQAAAWILLFVYSCGLAWISNDGRWGSQSYLLWASAAAYPLAVFGPLRRWVWLFVLVATAVAVWPASGFLAPPLLLGFSPLWIPPKAMEGAIVFYDGECGLCHRGVRLVLAEDRLGQFRLGPLQGETCKKEIDPQRLATLGDTLVVKHNGQFYARSESTRVILDGLGGLWRVLAFMLRLLPLPLRDFGYNMVARARKRIFAKPTDVCPIMPADLRERFLL